LRATATPTIDSGSLKHDCESWGSVNLCAYVSRGAQIAAAVALGYKVQAHRQGPHVQIGVSLKDFKKLVDGTLTLRRKRHVAVD
jgi:hypothetical protein